MRTEFSAACAAVLGKAFAAAIAIVAAWWVLQSLGLHYTAADTATASRTMRLWTGIFFITFGAVMTVLLHQHMTIIDKESGSTETKLIFHPLKRGELPTMVHLILAVQALFLLWSEAMLYYESAWDGGTEMFKYAFSIASCYFIGREMTKKQVSTLSG